MASEVIFTTNPADFTKLEALYIVERDPPAFIQSADLSAVGMGGLTVRGPLTVQEITSTARFLEVYGGRDQGSGGALVNEIWAALLNKPFGRLYVRRVAAADAVASSLTIEEGVDGTGTAVARIDASSVGTWGNNVYVRVEDATDGDADKWNLRVRYLGVETLFENLNTTTGNDNLAMVIGDDLATEITVTKLADGRPATFSTITEADWEAKDGAAGTVLEDFMALGTTLTAYTSVAGSDGTLVATDWTTAVTDLAVAEGPNIVLMAGAQGSFHDDVNAQYVTEAPNVYDRVFLAWSGTFGNTVTAEKTTFDTDITTRTDRIIWCFNSGFTVDPETGLQIERPPHEWMASILSNNDVDIHPGSRAARAQLAGIRKLNNETLTVDDLETLKAHGISTLEKVRGGFQFRSGLTTSLETGKKEITRRRSADLLQLSAADELVDFVKAKNTIENRTQATGLLVGFSQSLRDQGRIIEDFKVTTVGINTAAQRAQGIEKIRWSVKLIGHVLALVLETEIGTGVIIEAD